MHTHMEHKAYKRIEPMEYKDFKKIEPMEHKYIKRIENKETKEPATFSVGNDFKKGGKHYSPERGGMVF